MIGVKTLSFKFGACVESHDHEARILVDGEDVLERIDKTSLGIDPVEFFAQKALFEGGELLIGRCSCGCVGCRDEVVRTVHELEVVRWDSEYPSLSNVAFSRTEYLSSVRRAKSDTSWETIERTAERLVGQLDFSEFAKQGLVFQWASARINRDKIALSFLRAGKQELLFSDWNHRDANHAVASAEKFIRKSIGA
jgi:hypothetical protein